MTTTPVPSKRVTQSFLNQEFDTNGWEKRLASYTKTDYYDKPTPAKAGQTEGTSTIGHLYYDAQKTKVALVFQYRKPDGKLGASGRMTPKGLLIGGFWCYT